MVREQLISLIELGSRVDHLLLTEERELIGPQSILVILEESILVWIAFGVGMDLLDCGVVHLCLGSSGISSTVTGQDVGKGDRATQWHIAGDTRGHTEERTVLTPVV